jgi:uncharacterized membrane protein
MLFIVGASLICLILILPTLNHSAQPIALLVILTSLVAISVNVYILMKDVTKKSITHKKFRLIPCHRDILFFGKEFILCFRCLGFYVGTLFWGILTSLDRYIWADFLTLVGPICYTVLLFGVVATVPIHGAWLRRHPSKTRKQNMLRSTIGFIFSVSLWLICGLIVYFVRGH